MYFAEGAGIIIRQVMIPFEILLGQPFDNLCSLLGVGGRPPFDDGFKGRRSLEDVFHSEKCFSLRSLHINQCEMYLYTFE